MKAQSAHALAAVGPMRALAGVLALVAIAGVAAAQTQTGNNLQRDLSRVKTGPGQPQPNAYGAQSARDVVQEVRLRNAIVTGNATGGRSFRGNVGYTAPEDFRGTLGSDDTFAFRRDALPSGAGGMGFRGTESLQYQFAYTTGSSTAYSTRLGGSSASLPSALTGPTRATDASGLQTRQTSGEGAWSTSAANMGTLRSIGAFQSSRLLTPSVIGYRPTFAGLERTTASTLLGVRTITLGTSPVGGQDASVQPPRPNAVNTSATAPGAAAGPVNTAAPTNAAPSGSAAIPAGVTPPAITQPTPTQPGPDDATNATPADIFEAARQKIRGGLNATPTPTPTDPSALPGTDMAQPGDEDAAQAVDPYDARMSKLRDLLDPNKRRREPRIDPNTPDNQLTPEQRAQRAANDGSLAGVDAELLDILRNAKVSTSSLVMDPQSKDAIDAQMLRGERLMGEGRYFDAEEQFARVVSFRPGNTAALIGRAHAQLGAGLFLSSALNLREAFANQPETMTVRYQPPAIPDAERLRNLVERLRSNLQSGKAMRESAILVAYIGNQLDDAAIRKEGLAAMRAVDLEDPMPDVLERAWMPAK